MKPLEIKKDVYWIGATDYNKRNFHGYSLSPRGTTYNAYCITDEKKVVFDTVDLDYVDTMLCRLSKLGPLDSVDYLVINHTEKDHAGALAELVKATKPEKIITSPMGKKFMELQFDTCGWPIQEVRTGDVLNIGARNVHFVETPMLHWPDSMLSYVAEDTLLISNDAFGQNIASSERFVDEYDRSLFGAAVKEYYYNIVLPYSPQVLKALDAVVSMKLDIDMIAPDHGLIFRKKECIAYILDMYRQMAEQKMQKRAIVVYDTMWKSTEKMALAIASGFEESGVPCIPINMQRSHHSDVMTALADASAVVVGSPTHNNTLMPGIADVLTYMKGLRPQNRIGAAFGSYGWSGEGAKHVYEWLAGMNFEMIGDPLAAQFVPKHDKLKECYDLGAEIAGILKKRCE